MINEISAPYHERTIEQLNPPAGRQVEMFAKN